MIRDEAALWLHRWREVLAAGGAVLFGLWVASKGGFLLMPAGLAIAAVAAGLTLQAFRRMRFAQATAAPGIVEVDEAQIAYLSAEGGGFVSLSDLMEIRLLALRGRRFWRLRQADGQALLIPVDAAGADQLFDAFTVLPGMDSAALVAAVEGNGASRASLPALDGISHIVWQRPGKGIATRQP